MDVEIRVVDVEREAAVASGRGQGRDGGARHFCDALVQHDELPPEAAALLVFERGDAELGTVAVQAESGRYPDAYADEAEEGARVGVLSDAKLDGLVMFGLEDELGRVDDISTRLNGHH